MVFDVTQATLNHDFRRDTDGQLWSKNEIDFVTTAEYSTGKRVTMYIPFGIGLNINLIIIGRCSEKSCSVLPSQINWIIVN
jgi:hypothetical protein